MLLLARDDRLERRRKDERVRVEQHQFLLHPDQSRSREWAAAGSLEPQAFAESAEALLDPLTG